MSTFTVILNILHAINLSCLTTVDNVLYIFNSINHVLVYFLKMYIKIIIFFNRKLAEIARLYILDVVTQQWLALA